MRARRTTYAFTLIELLTVVAIISLLISILTPSLSRARAQAKAAACGARLHDYGLGLTVYANNHGSQLPVAEFNPDGEAEKWGWAELLCEQNYHYKPQGDPDEPFPIQRNTDNVGRFHFYYFNCPARGKEANHTGHYRVYLPGWAYAKSDPSPTKSATIDAIPPQVPILGDAQGGQTDEPNAATSYIAGGNAASGIADVPTFSDHHYGRVNLLYPDGHNELVPYPDDPNKTDNLFLRLNEDWELDGKPNLPET